MALPWERDPAPAVARTGAIEQHSFDDSSNLASAEYIGSAEILEVAFRDGSRYRYHGVPADTWRDLRDFGGVHGSYGEFFRREIRGRYSHVRMDAKEGDGGSATDDRGVE